LEKPAASAGDKEKEKEKGWIAGEELDKALAEDGWEERFDVKWPFRYSRASEQDWEGKEFLL
jgi:actin-related protein 9